MTGYFLLSSSHFIVQLNEANMFSFIVPLAVTLLTIHLNAVYQ